MNKIKKKKKKNLYIGYNTRLFINISSFIIYFILFLIFVFKAFSISPEKKLNYIDKSNLDYKVYLKENDFYNVDYLDKDMMYVASLINKVNVTFNYDFSSDINLNLDFKYNIIGKLTIQDSTGKSNYYENTYILLNDKKTTLKNDNKQNIHETINIDYDYYNNIANVFKTNYGVNTISKLTLYLTIDKSSKDEKIMLKDLDVMSLEIPLSERSINIEMNYKEIDNISNIIMNSNVFIDNMIYIILLLIFIVLLIISTVKITRLLSLLINKKTKYDKYVNRLLTEYDRLISNTLTQPNTDGIEIINIESFQELVDIRDNLSLPIMYYSITKHHKCWFYISHNNKMYLYVVKAVDLEVNKNG